MRKIQPSTENSKTPQPGQIYHRTSTDEYIFIVSRQKNSEFWYETYSLTYNHRMYLTRQSILIYCKLIA